jgi:hypothetical protein
LLGQARDAVHGHPPALVLAPGLKILKKWVELTVWVALKVSVNGDVAPVADLLAQVHRVKDVLGLKEGVGPAEGG